MPAHHVRLSREQLLHRRPAGVLVPRLGVAVEGEIRDRDVAVGVVCGQKHEHARPCVDEHTRPGRPPLSSTGSQEAGMAACRSRRAARAASKTSTGQGSPGSCAALSSNACCNRRQPLAIPPVHMAKAGSFQCWPRHTTAKSSVSTMSRMGRPPSSTASSALYRCTASDSRPSMHRFLCSWLGLEICDGGGRSTCVCDILCE